MKWLSRAVFWLITLAIVLTVAAVILIQTSWGTRQLAGFISDNSRWQVSLSEIDQSLSSPSIITLRDLSVRTATGEVALDAAAVELKLDWRSLTEPGWFPRILVQKGRMELASAADKQTLPLHAGVLQFNQMDIQRTDGNQQITANGVTGGMTPWQPQDADITGDGKYQFSAKSFSYYGLPLHNILVQGEIRGQQFTFENLTATLENGLVTANGQRSADGKWQIDNLMLNDIRWQTPLTLTQIAENSAALPPVQVRNITATNIKLEGNQWAVSYLEGTLKNMGYAEGRWLADNGLADIGIADLTLGGEHFSDLLGTLEFSGNKITVPRLTGRYDKSILRFTGGWDRATKALDIRSGVADNLLYSLPENWFSSLQESAPAGIDTIRLEDIRVSNALLIDTAPQFPFQMTAVNGYIKQMQILKAGQWGLWNGELSASAGNATFNRVELHRPYLTLTAGETTAATSQFAASAGDGLLKMQFEVTPGGVAPFTFAVQGTGADSQILTKWGWPAAPMSNEADFTLSLIGQLRADTVRSTLSGGYSGRDKQGVAVRRQITQGQVSVPAGTGTEIPVAPPADRVVPDSAHGEIM